MAPVNPTKGAVIPPIALPMSPFPESQVNVDNLIRTIGKQIASTIPKKSSHFFDLLLKTFN
jgi:hypothetical protein